MEELCVKGALGEGCSPPSSDLRGSLASQAGEVLQHHIHSQEVTTGSLGVANGELLHCKA